MVHMTSPSWPWSVPVWRGNQVVAHVLVDEDAYEAVSAFRWRLHPDGYATRSGTRPPSTERGVYHASSTLLLHRELMADQLKPGLWIDHINRDRLDCRRANLRVIDPRVSPQNTSRSQRRNRAVRSSRHRGVSWHKNEEKWRATVGVNGRTVHLGYFNDEDEAAQVAAAYRRKHLPYSMS
jgi:HNH endonuclease